VTAPLDAAFCALVVVVAALWCRRTRRHLQEGREQLQAKSAELARRNDQTAQIEGRYRTLFESVPVAIIVAQIDGTLIDVNRAAVRLFGYDSRHEMMASNMRTYYVNPAERDHRIAAALDEQQPKASEFLMRRRDGKTFPALTQNHVIRDSNGVARHVEGFVTDISEYKRLEEDRRAMEHEQRISQRLQSVGALAAGIAHEINTPMQFVSDSVYFLKKAVVKLNALWPELTELSRRSHSCEDLSDTTQRIGTVMSQIDVDELVADAHQSADRALDGIRRVTTIIRAMREFAHPDNGERSQVDINHAIETTLTVCRNVFKEVAQVETEFGALPPVTCQYGEMNQVFLNIIVNAAHAIEGAQKFDSRKGTIRITTGVEPGWAVIRIQDNGTGIPESVKARIFDPFFTTKEVGKGTGQGLAIARSVIVERHRGRISVDSKVGEGTTFILRLPIEDRSSAAKEKQCEQ
jgi:two-component system NtrC family sensor kinase